MHPRVGQQLFEIPSVTRSPLPPRRRSATAGRVSHAYHHAFVAGVVEAKMGQTGGHRHWKGWDGPDKMPASIRRGANRAPCTQVKPCAAPVRAENGGILRVLRNGWVAGNGVPSVFRGRGQRGSGYRLCRSVFLYYLSSLKRDKIWGNGTAIRSQVARSGGTTTVAATFVLGYGANRNYFARTLSGWPPLAVKHWHVWINAAHPSIQPSPGCYSNRSSPRRQCTSSSRPRPCPAFRGVRSICPGSRRNWTSRLCPWP